MTGCDGFPLNYQRRAHKRLSQKPDTPVRVIENKGKNPSLHTRDNPSSTCHQPVTAMAELARLHHCKEKR